MFGGQHEEARSAYGDRIGNDNSCRLRPSSGSEKYTAAHLAAERPDQYGRAAKGAIAARPAACDAQRSARTGAARRSEYSAPGLAWRSAVDASAKQSGAAARAKRV